jgi:hypothetical protein
MKRVLKNMDSSLATRTRSLSSSPSMARRPGNTVSLEAAATRPPWRRRPPLEARGAGAGAAAAPHLRAVPAAVGVVCSTGVLATATETWT